MFDPRLRYHMRRGCCLALPVVCRYVTYENDVDLAETIEAAFGPRKSFIFTNTPREIDLEWVS